MLCGQSSKVPGADRDEERAQGVLASGTMVGTEGALSEVVVPVVLPSFPPSVHARMPRNLHPFCGFRRKDLPQKKNRKLSPLSPHKDLPQKKNRKLSPLSPHG